MKNITSRVAWLAVVLTIPNIAGAVKEGGYSPTDEPSLERIELDIKDMTEQIQKLQKQNETINGQLQFLENDVLRKALEKVKEDMVKMYGPGSFNVNYNSKTRNYEIELKFEGSEKKLLEGDLILTPEQQAVVRKGSLSTGNFKDGPITRKGLKGKP